MGTRIASEAGTSHGPRDNPLQCFVKRNRSTQTYYLFLSLTNALSDDGKFLLAARRCRRVTCIDYIISLDADDMSKGSNTYVGKLRSNFLRNKFTIYDGQPPHKGAKTTKNRSVKHGNLNQVSPKVSTGNYPVAHISYVLGTRYARLHSARNATSRSPRRMKCVMDTIPASAIQPGGVGQPIQAEFSPSNVEKVPLFPFFRSKSNRIENSVSESPGSDKMLVLKSKHGFWSERFGCWCIYFKGRVNVKSVKNCQLVASPENGPSGEEHKKIILQFGKVGKDLFTMDYQYPISAFQAFAICLSRFETQILLED
ncbi:hypothetical protein K1719_006207 [Acacia pycnantha]|nr:hypothetical protein K1719_006207 [Acacia pycnantha]